MWLLLDALRPLVVPLGGHVWEHGFLLAGGPIGRRRSVRAGRVYVDWLQNDPSRQTVAPYSLRGMPRPTVATPVRWDEVEHAADERRPELLVFEPAHVLARIEQYGDLFAALA
jgi:DNA primase